MRRVARDRIDVLFALAESEAGSGGYALADRYVALARRIGTRYNVRLLPEYRERYCRGCSRFWIEGRTVRTRFRAGRRVRTCLACGRVRRVPLRPTRSRTVGTTESLEPFGRAREPVPADLGDEDALDDLAENDGAEEE